MNLRHKVISESRVLSFRPVRYKSHGLAERIEKIADGTYDIEAGALAL